MDGPPAQSLGVEDVDHDVMKRPPRKRDASIVTPGLLGRVARSALTIVLGTMLVYVMELSGQDDSARTTTMVRPDYLMPGTFLLSLTTRTTHKQTFTTFVLFDLFNALNCRSSDKSVFQIGLFSNRMFTLSFLGSVVCQMLVIYFPPLQSIFQTRALHFRDLLAVVVLASSVFWIEELRKSWAKNRLARKSVYNFEFVV